MQSYPDAAYAAWSERFRALLLDIGIVFGVLFVVGIGLAIILTLTPGGGGDISAGVGALIGLAFPVPFAAYLGVFHGGARGQTPGKRALGIAVRHASTLDRISYRRGLGRSCLTMLFWLLWLWLPFVVRFPLVRGLVLVGILDGLWPLWDSRRQALHDKAAQTVVIRIAPTPATARFANPFANPS